jgi:DNA-3-methyladenine glycosylase
MRNIIDNFEIATSSFYVQPTELVAKRLIGGVFSTSITEPNRKVLLRIVETEAYLSYGDEASHSFRGKTNRNSAMFDRGGILYVYMIYGIHHCINVVTEAEGVGAAVLLRAMEYLEGEDEFTENAFRGPGNIAKSLGYSLEQNRKSLCNDEPTIYLPKFDVPIRTTPRIGISKSKDLPLRFCLEGSPFVSVDWKKNVT